MFDTVFTNIPLETKGEKEVYKFDIFFGIFIAVVFL